MGNTATHRGGVLPGWVGQRGSRSTRRQWSDVQGRAGVRGEAQCPARGADRGVRSKPTDARRQAQDSVRRGARNQAAAAGRCRYEKAGNVRNARCESGTLVRARLAEAGCLLSVRASAQSGRPADRSPATTPVNRWALWVASATTRPRAVAARRALTECAASAVSRPSTRDLRSARRARGWSHGHTTP